MSDPNHAIAKRVAELVRRRALAAIVRHDESLAKVYDQIAEGIRSDLRATGFTIAQVRDIVEKRFGSTVAERQRIVEDAILQAAREARVLPQETFDAIYGKEATSAEAAPFDRACQTTIAQLLRLVRESEDE